MSNTSIIMGESGTGKSTSIRTLDPSETFIINVLNKPLPFRGYKKNYEKIVLDENGTSKGNYYSSKNYDAIHKVLRHINTKRPEIKTIILDDFQYLMADEFMARALEKGYDKFSLMGKNAYDLLQALPTLRDDLDIFILTHSEANEAGKMKFKTIGKMLDEKIVIEGMYCMVLQTELTDGKYAFVTQGDARNIAKSPMGMFEDKKIPNDLAYVKSKMHTYYNEDIAV